MGRELGVGRAQRTASLAEWAAAAGLSWTAGWLARWVLFKQK